MKSTLTISVRVGVKRLASLLAAALNAGILEDSAQRGSPRAISAANLVRLAMASATAPLKGTEYEITSLEEAWELIEKHGISGQNSKSKPRVMGLLDPAPLGDVVYDEMVEKYPQPIDNETITVLESIANKRGESC